MSTCTQAGRCGRFSAKEATLSTHIPSPASRSQDALSFRDPAENPRRGARRLRSDPSPSSLRLATDRAPRLRRVADLVAAQAISSPMPDRALRLARDLRIRASQIECGDDYAEHANNLELLAAVLAGA